MIATILGCGEAFDDSLPSTSILLHEESTLLLDCGYSAPPRIWSAITDPNAIDAIYLSHAHADHYFGMPALLGRFWEDGRTKALIIISQPTVLDQLRQLLDLGYKGLSSRLKYPIEYCHVKPGASLDLFGLSMAFAETLHSVSNLAIRVEARGGSVVFSGDGMFTQESRALCSQADLVIHEAYGFEPSPVHADIPSLITMCDEEQVRHLAMVHVRRNVRKEQRNRIEEGIREAPGRRSLPDPGESYRVAVVA